MKKSPGSQKTSSTSWTSLLLLFLSGKGKKKDRERKKSFTWLFCLFLWEQEQMNEQLLAIGKIAESPARTTGYCWGASGSIWTVHWVVKFEMVSPYCEEKQRTAWGLKNSENIFFSWDLFKFCDYQDKLRIKYLLLKEKAQNQVKLGCLGDGIPLKFFSIFVIFTKYGDQWIPPLT